MRLTDLPDSIRKAVQGKCGGIVSLESIWGISARRLLDAGLSESKLVLLVDTLPTARTLDVLVSGLARSGVEAESFFGDLLACSDESDFSLAEWFESIECVQAHLAESNRTAGPASLLGYVHCTAEFASHTNSRESLPSLIAAMLREHGFSGEEGCANGVSE